MSDEWLLLPLSDYLNNLWPAGFPELPSMAFLEGASMEPLNITRDAGVTARAGLVYANDIPLGIPGVDALSVVLKAPGAGKAVGIIASGPPDGGVRVEHAPLALRISRELLAPGRKVAGSDGRFTVEADPAAAPIELSAGEAALAIDLDGNVSFDGGAALNLPLCVVGNTGIGLEAQNVQFAGSTGAPPPGQPAGWRGLFIEAGKLYLPGDLGASVGELALSNAYIGNGGFSGAVSNVHEPPLQSRLLGMAFELAKVELAFKQNTLAASLLAGRIKVPFFDEWVAVEAGFGLDGHVHLRLSGGLPVLSKPGVLEIHLDSLAFDLDGDRLGLTLSGRLTPLFAGLTWPTLDLRELSIDADGNVHLAGGWLDLGNQFSLDFFGFAMEITRLGFGRNPDGSRWVGFSGGIHLVDGLPAGAAVDGLRITWRDGGDVSLSLEGIAVELEVPGAFKFKGKVTYREAQNRFDGAIQLELVALRMKIDGLLVVGRDRGTNYFAIYLALDLPAGIPLGPTGVGLYGMAGLFAMAMGPNKAATEGWYQNADGGNGWYLRPQPGVYQLASKWDPSPGGLAFGAGLTIGTQPDNGFSFSGRVLLAIVFPGPVLIIEGRGNILRERGSLEDDPMFRALAVLDMNADTFTLGLAAHYQYLVDAELIDLSGNAEVFFKFNDPGAWHVWIGRKEPRSQRISADIFFRLFGANAYFMLDTNALALGAWVGYDRHFEFGPLALDLESWIEGNAALTVKPLHFHGDLWLHGRWAASAFGFGVGMSVDARLATDVFRPWYIDGRFDVSLELPWPLPDVGATVHLTWGTEGVPQPPIPLPLKEVTVEHLKTRVTWPLPRKANPALLVPDYDDGGMIKDPPPAFDPNAAPPGPEVIPVIPLDPRVSLTFGRHVNDDAGIGIPARPEVIEQIGDPAAQQGPLKVRYGLKSVRLERWTGAAWEPVAARPAAAGQRELYASWLPAPGQSQTKLLLWSKSAFDYTRNADQAWNDLALKDATGYPCQAPPPPKLVCFDWQWAAAGATLTMPWQHPQDTRLGFKWLGGTLQAAFVITALWGDRALLLPVANREGALDITLPWPAGLVQATIFTDQAGEAVQLICFDAAGAAVTAVAGPGTGVHKVVLSADANAAGGRDFVAARLTWRETPIYLAELCLREGGRRGLEDQYNQTNKHLQGELARWSQEGEVLQPHTTYRLQVVTAAKPVAPAGTDKTQTEYAFFRTQGPPGLAALSRPIGLKPGQEWASGIDDLTLYVRQTLPETVPAAGQRPRRPRPVYRAYDVGVAYNENYVELMYRMGGRDLGLYLFDSNNRPARDMAGRLLALGNPWGKAEDLLLTDGDAQWVKKVQASNCATIDVSKIARDRVMLASDGHLLAGGTVYEARLVPLLFHDDFSSGLDGWQVVTLGGGAPNWTTEFHAAIKGSNATVAGMAANQAILQLDAGVDLSGVAAGDDVIRLWDDRARASRRYRVAALNAGAGQVTVDGAPVLNGGKSTWEIPAFGGAQQKAASESVLLRGDAGWTDYRFSAYVRLGNGRRAGLVARWRDAANHVRLTFSTLSVIFEQVAGGVSQLQRETALGVTGDRLLTIEAIGATLRAYVDGDFMGEIDAPALAAGQAGLYADMPAGGSARFSDARLDDLRANAPVVYRFNFTTSAFANFYHHLHSYDDSVFAQDVPAAAGFQGRAVALNAAWGDEAESRAYRELAEAALGSAAHREPPALRATRLETNAAAAALLIQGPEPVDWSRAALSLLAAAPAGLKPVPPGAARLAEAHFGATQPNEESITLLAREAMDLGSGAIEYRWLPGQAARPADPLLRSDSFRTDQVAAGVDRVLWQPAFADLSEVTVAAQPQVLGGAPQWGATGGVLAQAAGTWVRRLGQFFPVPDFSRPATWVEAGDAGWTDVRVTASVAVPNGGAAGILFRYGDARNFYYLALQGVPGQPGRATLIRSANGVRTTLGSATLPVTLDAARQVVVEARGAVLAATLEGVALFTVTDQGLAAGRMGFGTNQAAGATFAGVRVDAIARRLGDWAVIDETGTGGPSQWAVEDGALRQKSAVGANTPGMPGTFLAAGDAGWIDYRFEALVRSDAPGAIGLIFRYTDPANYYRFSLDRTGNYRRLVRVTVGAATTLWEATTADAYPLGNAFRLAVEAIGPHLTGYVDGVQAFSVRDAGHAAGMVGLYCASNPGVLVFEDEVRFSEPQWQRYHTFAAGETLPPGGRLRLFAGNANQAPAPQTGALDRFVAQGAEAGTLRLPPEGVDLQLLLRPAGGAAAAPEVAHRRRFRPDAAYTAVDARILRKGDGTAWALFPVPGTPAFPPGEYRMKITFRRDNTGTVNGSPVYSQAGDRSDEVVWLDVPWEG